MIILKKKWTTYFYNKYNTCYLFCETLRVLQTNINQIECENGNFLDLRMLIILAKKDSEEKEVDLRITFRDSDHRIKKTRNMIINLQQFFAKQE